MKQPRFATAINCIDGRAQVPVIDWLKLHCNVDYVDVITEPGADLVLVQGPASTTKALEDKVRLSFRNRQSPVIAVVAHHGCIANPVAKEEHWELLDECVREINAWGLPARIVGLWVNEWGAIDVVSDTQERKPVNSFL